MLAASVSYSYLVLSFFLFFSPHVFADVHAPELLSKIHMANEMEIKAGQIALQKSQRIDIRKYAEDLIRDHTQTDKLVMTLVDTRDVTLLHLPASPEDKEMMRKIQTTLGRTFDLVFATEMEKGHARVIAELEGYLQNLDGSQLDLYLLVKGILPVLKRHHEKARELRTTLQAEFYTY